MHISNFIRPCLTGSLLALALAPSVANADAFNGPYAGVEAGLGILKTEGSILTGPISESDNSAMVSAVAGYRMPLGDSPVVLGAEGSVGTYTSGKGDLRYGAAGIGGVKLGERALVYGKVGYAWLDGVPNGTGEGIDGLVLGGRRGTGTVRPGQRAGRIPAYRLRRDQLSRQHARFHRPRSDRSSSVQLLIASDDRHGLSRAGQLIASTILRTCG